MLKRKSNTTLLSNIEEKIVFKERKSSISTQLLSLSSDLLSTDSYPPNEEIILHKVAASSKQFVNDQKQHIREKKESLFLHLEIVLEPEFIDTLFMERKKIIRAKEDGVRKKKISQTKIASSLSLEGYTVTHNLIMSESSLILKNLPQQKLKLSFHNTTLILFLVL